MRNKIIALCLGITCHVTFIASISAMAYMLFFGLSRGIFPVGGTNRNFNLFLIIQFPLLHSFFLSKSGRALLTFPFPKEIGRDLSTTTFALLSSLQLLSVFIFWTPTKSIWFSPAGIGFWINCILYTVSWGLLVASLHEAGMSLQVGSLGWLSVFRGKKVQFPGFPTTGLHKISRQPIYWSFALILLTAPVWTPDHLLFAFVWVSYCIFGPMLKEERMRSRYGELYEQYSKYTPYFLSIKLPNKNNSRTRKLR